MRGMDRPDFQEASHTPNYDAMRESDIPFKSCGFGLQKNGEDVFIHASRESEQYQGQYVGDKFHISVKKDELPKAFQAVSGLLFSEGSPIDKWKVTDIMQVGDQSRVGEGAQFTLYVKPDGTDSQYSALALSKTKHFVESLESRLAAGGIAPGEHPASDVRSESWQYVSYRNESRSNRDGGEAQSQALRDEPFYRLMTE